MSVYFSHHDSLPRGSVDTCPKYKTQLDGCQELYRNLKNQHSNLFRNGRLRSGIDNEIREFFQQKARLIRFLEEFIQDMETRIDRSARKNPSKVGSELAEGSYRLTNILRQFILLRVPQEREGND